MIARKSDEMYRYTFMLGRYAANSLTRLGGWARRRHRYNVLSGKILKVNLGCGMSVASGWLNIDGSLNALISRAPRWVHPVAYKFSGSKKYYSKDTYCSILRDHTFAHHNLIYGIPLNDNSADFIYTSHFLEHLDKLDGKRLLQECLRVLKPHGILRIGVPDLEKAWLLYRHGEKEQMLQTYFFVADGADLSGHRYAYDYEMLKQLLEKIGFVDITKAEFRKGSTPDLEVLDNREDQTLFVEARCP